MNIIYWNVKHHADAWRTAAAWLQHLVPGQTGVGPLNYVPDAMILAEPSSTIPSSVYGNRGLVHGNGYVSQAAPSPPSPAVPWCIRQFTVRGGMGNEQELMYVIWNNVTCNVTSNTVVNTYMDADGRLTPGSRIPVAMNIASRLVPGAQPLRVAAVHLSPDPARAYTCISQWTQALVAAQQQINAPDYFVGTVLGDFNLAQENIQNWFVIASDPGALTSITPTNTFSSPWDKVLAAHANPPGILAAGRVYGAPQQPPTPRDLLPVPPGFGFAASDHVPIYLSV